MKHSDGPAMCRLLNAGRHGRVTPADDVAGPGRGEVDDRHADRLSNTSAV